MIPKENRARIIAALKDAPNAKKVAREVGGASYRTVVRLAKGAGIELTVGKAARGRDRPSPEKRAEIVAALKDNPNTLQVARQVGGVSHWTVGKIAKAAGIELCRSRKRKTPFGGEARTNHPCAQG
jgi:transposase-like protein